MVGVAAVVDLIHSRWFVAPCAIEVVISLQCVYQDSCYVDGDNVSFQIVSPIYHPMKLHP